MARIIRDLGPGATETAWSAAQESLRYSDTIIGHIDTGLFPHKTLGYDDADNPPPNILLDQGLNVFDPKPGDDRPVTDLTVSSGAIAGKSEFPDHGVKTLSIILADRKEKLTGVAPGAKIIPYRVSNSPVFLGGVKTNGIGRAMSHALNLPSPPKVFSISMGNPGVIGPK